MLNKRIIPILLIKDGGLVKGENFKNHSYVGDPINAVRIFNEKEVDELVLLDITAYKNNRIDFNLLSDIASEAFMPLSYGGGIKNVLDAEKILHSGFEKIIINSSAYFNPGLITQLVSNFGSSSVVCSVDIGKNIFGKKQIFVQSGRLNTKLEPFEYIQSIQDLGVGEIIICPIDKEGSRTGFDLEFFKKISISSPVPIIASGGARNIEDFSKIFSETLVSAASAGEMFIYYGSSRGVLINYPDYELICDIIKPTGSE